MSSPTIAPGRQVSLPSRAIPLSWVLLLAILVHGSLLLMQLPNDSYDADFHKFFAAHYAAHWFNPWNEKWFTGFSQTTYPPMEQQWMALFSHIIGLNLAYSLVQLIAILLLPIGVYRYARIWVSERAASYAAIGSVLLGSLSSLVYQAGQLSTTWAAPLYLIALAYFYEWAREARFMALIKALALTMAAASAHHVTLLFASVIFAIPVMFTAIIDRKRDGLDATLGGVIIRSAVYAGLTIAGVIVVLLPYWVALMHNPIKQMPIPHGSRENFFSQWWLTVNYILVPWGALLLALPFIFYKGLKETRLRPLFFGFWFTMLFALGGTTPFPRALLGAMAGIVNAITGKNIRNPFDILTFERFCFWASLMALPIVALLAVKLIDRYGNKASFVLGTLGAATMAWAVAWPVYHPIHDAPFSTSEVVSFLNRDGHDKFRYLTLGFGSKMSEVGIYANASSVDGEYNSARLLPEMTKYGSAQLTNSKYYGTNGIESLRAVLKHADQYGLKYIFVRDPYYEPLLAFAGWRKTEVYDRGNVTLWVKDGIPPAHPTPYGTPPTAMEGILWGTLPIGSSILALVLMLLFPDRRRTRETLKFPMVESEEPLLREAR
ncbi:MAG TPA: hypothetical protein VFR24_26410 [Candidatus Angelobacter sp.]|nr:hypothetical protein [Candidatus Angelobacter sp.]